MKPPGAIGNQETRALMAVLAGARTVEDVNRLCGWQSRGGTHSVLVRLRDRGLVTWEPNKAGTLRPLVKEATR